MSHIDPEASGIAIVFGASGGIGRALVTALSRDTRYSEVLAFSRSGPRPFDLTDEQSIAAAAAEVSSAGPTIRTIIDATGALAAEGCTVEKSWRQIDPAAMARALKSISDAGYRLVNLATNVAACLVRSSEPARNLAQDLEGAS